MSQLFLVRYGLIPEVARFSAADGAFARGERVVVRSHRGEELGTVLERLKNGARTNDEAIDSTSIVRAATLGDEQQIEQSQAECRDSFEDWRRRIADWDLQLELIDLEWLLEKRTLVLYVLNDRGSDCTKLAIYAAAEGLANVTVQPVDINGLVQMEPAAGGCGSGGGCGSCSSETH